MNKIRLMLFINGSQKDAKVYINKFDKLKEDINDCLPLGKGTIGEIDYNIIDIEKTPEEAERMNIKSIPTLMIGKLKILGLDDLETVVNKINEYVG